MAGLVEKRRQLHALFGSYSRRIERLYDNFINKLTDLAHDAGVGVETLLKTDALFGFSNYPELQQELNRIFSDYVQKDVLAYKAGITDGVALAYSHDKALLTGFSVLSDKAISHARNIAAETFIRSRMRTAKGLSLSQLVWNYAQQSKSEFEVAVSNVISDGLKKGTSAEELGRMVREYLNNPDMMYRRYHRTVVDANGNKKDVVKWRRRVVDESGKVRFVEEPLEQVGMGHYRSSRKNANRLMRTEINGAYHRANSERWQMEPFVIGIAIELSPQHPEEDMCDFLSGENFEDPKGHYPKDFVFTGWHPQCLCMSNPITIQGEEKKEFYRRLAAGEDMSNYVSPNAVKNIPDTAKQWIDDNRDQFIRAGERGKLGYIWQENKKYWQGQFSREELSQMGYASQRTKRIKTEEERADIQRRWNERRKNNETLTRGRAFLDNIKDFPELQIFGLKDAVDSRDYTRIESIVDALRPRLKYERSITPNMLLDSVMRKKYGDEAIDALYTNVKRTIDSKVTGDIDAKIKALRYEADWVVKNRSFATVKEVAAYYEREAVRLEAMRNFDKVRNEILAIERNLTKYGVETVLKGNEWYGDIATMQEKLRGLEKYKDKFDRIAKIEEYLKTSKSPVIRTAYESIMYNLQTYGVDARVDDLIKEAEKRIKHLDAMAKRNAEKKAKIAAEEYRKKMEAMYGKRITIDDLKAVYGDKLPKTLTELEDAIKQYQYVNATLKAKEQEINMLMKKFFDDNDLGMDISHNLLESVYKNGFYNTFQSGTSKGYIGSSKTAGRIEAGHDRLRMAHRMFLPSTMDDYAAKQLARSEYEKYGHLLDRNKYDALNHNLTHYGDVQVRFKKDKVLATWTYNDSLSTYGEYYQPSLVTDPRVESFDVRDSSRIKILAEDNDWNSVYKWQRNTNHHTSYIELQYHGKLDIDCVESLTFKSNPEDWISKELIDKLKEKGIELWYERFGEVVKY